MSNLSTSTAPAGETNTRQRRLHMYRAMNDAKLIEPKRETTSLEPPKDEIVPSRIFMLLEFAKAAPSRSFRETSNPLAPGGQILTDIAIIDRDLCAGYVETLKKGFEALYELSYAYADDIREADRIIEVANIYADLRTVRRKSDRNDHYISLCRIVIGHWVSWIKRKKLGADPFGRYHTLILRIHGKLMRDLGHTW